MVDLKNMFLFLVISFFLGILVGFLLSDCPEFPACPKCPDCMFDSETFAEFCNIYIPKCDCALKIEDNSAYCELTKQELSKDE